MPLRLLLALLWILLWTLAAEGDSSARLQLTANPPLEAVRPNHDETRLALSSNTNEAAGKIVRWNLTVLLPPRSGLFSTDFPWIEGKKLLEIDFLTVGKKVEWNMVFPIRGRYELRARTEVDGEAPVETTFSLVIHEDPARWFYLGLSLGGVFLLGYLLGWATPGSGALLVASLFCLVAVAAQAQLDVSPAKVGTITRVSLTLSDPGAAPIDFSIFRMEDKKRLFHIEGVNVLGQVSWGYHFFDGSLHQVRAAIRPRGSASPVVLEKKVHVEALEPPGNVVIATYAFFLLPLIPGWLTGRWIKRDRKKSCD